VAAALGYTSYQVKLLRRNYLDLHDWNRRKAAHDGVHGFIALAAGNKLINEAFGFMESNDPIPLEQVQSKCEEMVDLRAAIHRLLNTYETISTGVVHGVYDEAIVRDSMGYVISLTLFQFSEYIEHRRNRGSREMWCVAEQLSKKWKENQMPVVPSRPKTGQSV
jgi:uncharacterized protein DUF4760